MIGFANAKINIGLQVLNRREDGYHNIETVFYPIKMYDVVEITENATHTQLHVEGAEIGDADQNLCMKAYQLLRNDYDLPPVDIYLLKNIPIGSGLGGGSSDAAQTLKILNELFDLKLNSDSLEKYAARLGADCPFFIVNEPCLATGTGTDLTSLKGFDLEKYFIAVVKPEMSISTADAYGGIDSFKDAYDLKKAIREDIAHWQQTICNDFENHITKMHPIIGGIKQKLYDNGALYSAMSGSGSAVYGIFNQKVDLGELESLGKVYYPIEL